MKNISKGHFVSLIGLALVAAWGSGTARAADHANLEEGFPTENEDAYPVAYKAREFQLQGRYERTDGDNKFTLRPSFEYGFARNWQATIEVPFFFESADKTGSGSIGVGALYNFNQESLSAPAFAVAAHVDFPTGRDARGVDTDLKFIATKTLGNSLLLHRLHLNLIYRRNAKRREHERSNRYAAVVGYSRRLGPDTMLVTDFIHEQELEKGKTSNIFELGIRRQLTPLRVLSLGIGAGLNDEAPDFRITAGYQQTF